MLQMICCMHNCTLYTNPIHLNFRIFVAPTHRIDKALGVDCVGIKKFIRILWSKNVSNGKLIHLKCEMKRKSSENVHGCEAPYSESKLNNVCDVCTVFSKGNKPFWIILSFCIQRILWMLLLLPFHSKTCRQARYQRQCIKSEKESKIVKNCPTSLRYDIDVNLFVLFWINFFKI